ncbi:MAG: hypothetical protein JWO48_1085 [Bryobacterales bacterium]|nr:hypothetical protein [Bryobacterales bacterium]
MALWIAEFLAEVPAGLMLANRFAGCFTFRQDVFSQCSRADHRVRVMMQRRQLQAAICLSVRYRFGCIFASEPDAFGTAGIHHNPIFPLRNSHDHHRKSDTGVKICPAYVSVLVLHVRNSVIHTIVPPPPNNPALRAPRAAASLEPPLGFRETRRYPE